MSASTSPRSAKSAGLTLIEMILFIVVLGIGGAVILTTLSAPLTGAGTQTTSVTATQIAQARMELIVGQKRRKEFPGEDPCDGTGLAEACTTPEGWTVDSAMEAWDEDGIDDPAMDRYVVWLVTANGPDGEEHTIRALLTRLGD